MNSSMVGFLTLESMLGSVSSLEIAPFIVGTALQLALIASMAAAKGKLLECYPRSGTSCSMIYSYNLQLSDMIEIAPIELPHMDRGRGSSTHPSGTGDGTGPPADPQPGLCPQGQPCEQGVIVKDTVFQVGILRLAAIFVG